MLAELSYRIFLTPFLLLLLLGAAAAVVQAEAVINQAVSDHGRVDGVVNCVGSIVLKSAHTTSDADFDAVSTNGGNSQSH